MWIAVIHVSDTSWVLNRKELPKYQKEDGTTVSVSPTLAGTELHPHKARIRPEAVPLSKNFQMFVTAVKTI